MISMSSLVRRSKALTRFPPFSSLLTTTKQQQKQSFCSSFSSSSKLITSKQPCLSHHHCFSSGTNTAATSCAEKQDDESLIRAIQLSIQSTEDPRKDKDDVKQVLMTDLGFPFEIIDGNPGEHKIYLKRDFADEKIQVELAVNLEDWRVQWFRKDMDLTVTVVDGQGFCLDFNGIFSRSDGIEVQRTSVKGPDEKIANKHKKYLDYNWKRYLKRRGIKRSFEYPLREYIQYKFDVDHSHWAWLNNLKESLEK